LASLLAYNYYLSLLPLAYSYYLSLLSLAYSYCLSLLSLAYSYCLAWMSSAYSYCLAWMSLAYSYYLAWMLLAYSYCLAWTSVYNCLSYNYPLLVPFSSSSNLTLFFGIYQYFVYPRLHNLLFLIETNYYYGTKVSIVK
jgi:hypothetical protein